jgi:hypothetical protein
MAHFLLRTQQQRFPVGNERQAVTALSMAQGNDLKKRGRNDLCPCGSGRRFQKVLHGGPAVAPMILETITTGR